MPLYPARDPDLAAAARLINGAYRGEGARRGWTHEADLIQGARTGEAALRDDLAANPQARLLLWRETPDAEPLGSVWLEPAGVGVWYLGMLTVRPDLQAGGLGRRILEAAEAWAADLGARRVRMTVIGVREPLIAWYQRRGYALTGETKPFPYDEPHVGAPQRQDLGFVVLEKRL